MEYSPDEAKVLRSGKIAKIHSADLVPGDIISIAVGDKIPADSRVISISSASFTIDQALLTGESQSVSKYLNTVNDEDAVKQDMTNMLFSVRLPSPLFSLHKLTFNTIDRVRLSCQEKLMPS